jgi:hypothetical protein
LGVHVVEKEWLAGKYPVCNDPRMFRKAIVRVNAFGEGPAMPIAYMHAVSEVAEGIVGYTHLWRRQRVKTWSQYLMASVHSLPEAANARARGWRTYRVGGEKEAGLFEDKCPEGLSCVDCMLCCGGSRLKRSVLGKLSGNPQAKRLWNLTVAKAA